MRDHEVVTDAARLVEEQTVALATRLQAEHVDGQEGLQRARRVGDVARARREPDLAHMRHVEQAGRGPRVQVFLEQARRVLHRHGVARERDHPGPVAQVERVQGRAGNVLGDGISGHRVTPRRKASGSSTERFRLPPSVAVT